MPDYERYSDSTKLDMASGSVFAFADTVDIAENINAIDLESSVDGGKTWRHVGGVTGCSASAPRDDPKGEIQKPGIICNLLTDKSGLAFRATVSHREDIQAACAVIVDSAK